MWRVRLSSLLLFATLLFIRSALGQVSPSGLVSPAEAARAGLKRAWYTHVEVDRSKGRLAYVTQFISPTKATTTFEIEFDGGRIEISEKHLDPFGLPLGKEGAKAAADEKVAELEAKGLSPKLTTHVTPEITLYLATDRGVVHALDGETGRTRWALPIGKMNHPTLEPAASDRHVAVVNGSMLYLLSAADGKLVWEKQLKGAPGAGGAITGELVHVPMVNGMMESYKIAEPKRSPVFYKSHGRAMVQPVPTDKSVLWTTDRGHLYVGYADKPGVRYRLEANDTIASRATYKAPNQVFVASVDGYVYCIKEATGDLRWRFSAGEPISQQPLVVDDAVYVVTDHGNLFRINIENGVEQWSTPRVKGLLSASRDRLYCAGELGRVTVIDMKTGSRLASFEAVDLDIKFLNVLSDRIFLGTSNGIIQCLHELGQRYPLVHAGAVVEGKGKPQTVQKGLDEPEEGTGDKPATPAEPDPFEAKPKPEKKPPADDPFGA
jgi:outer membrane protein assembly factor BamB